MECFKDIKLAVLEDRELRRVERHYMYDVGELMKVGGGDRQVRYRALPRFRSSSLTISYTRRKLLSKKKIYWLVPMLLQPTSMNCKKT